MRSKPGNEPRQPDTPYICYWKYERPVVVAAFPTMSAPDVSREVGLRWKALSDDERAEWNALSARDRERYEEEMAAYRKRPSKIIPQDSITPSTSPVAADASTPRPPKSAFQCFLVHHRESLMLLSMATEAFRSEMSALWKRMGRAEKQVWLDMAADDLVRYETEMAVLKRPIDATRSRIRRLDELKAIATRIDNAPQLPQSALEFFAAAKKRELLPERPWMAASDVTREIDDAWNATATYDRLPFIGDELRDIERFVGEMEALVAEDSSVDEDPAADLEVLAAMDENAPPLHDRQAPDRLRRRAELTVPKRPLTAYNMMYLAKREELMRIYELSQNECSALCGRMWRQMAESERQQYHRLAAQDRERYVREMAQYRRHKSDTDQSQPIHEELSRRKSAKPYSQRLR